MNGELVEGTLPHRRRSGPFLLSVAESKEEKLGGCVVAGEMSLGLDDLSQGVVQGFDRVGGVDDASDLEGKGEEGADALPISAPGGDGHGVTLAPGALDF